MYFSASKATSSANNAGRIVRSLVRSQAIPKITVLSPIEMPMSRVMVDYSSLGRAAEAACQFRSTQSVVEPRNVTCRPEDGPGGCANCHVSGKLRPGQLAGLGRIAKTARRGNGCPLQSTYRLQAPCTFSILHAQSCLMVHLSFIDRPAAKHLFHRSACGPEQDAWGKYRQRMQRTFHADTRDISW